MREGESIERQTPAELFALYPCQRNESVDRSLCLCDTPLTHTQAYIHTLSPVPRRAVHGAVLVRHQQERQAVRACFAKRDVIHIASGERVNGVVEAGEHTSHTT